MEPVVLQSSHASEIASLWRSGVKENALAEESYVPHFSQEQYAARIAALLESGDILGWGIFLPSSLRMAAYLTAELKESAPEFVQRKFLYLHDLDVHHAERRKGLATILVETAKRYAQESGLSSIEVSWASADVQASAFWNVQGFGQYLSRARLSAEAFARDA
jgi:GNAT superfamily N-acetyltransferase